MSCRTPAEIVSSVSEIGCAKVRLDTGRLLVLGFLAGAYIAFGCLLALIVAAGAPDIASQNPGLHKLIFGAVFPVGLMLVVIGGAELFTGNAAVCVPAALSRRISWNSVLRNWALVYAGNFLGSLAVAYFLSYLTGLLAAEPWLSGVTSLAEGKVSQTFLVLLLKGVGCNWLVCLAVWLAVSADEVTGKVLGIWFPIMAFVAIGLEHSVANMYFIPTGMLYGAAVDWGQFLFRNLLPVTIGNIIGGAFFVGALYWYLYPRRRDG